MIKYDGYTNYVDPTCEVQCQCGRVLWLSDYIVTECPDCGACYKTEFVVWRLEDKDLFGITRRIDGEKSK